MTDTVGLHVETAPFPQTIECPRCGHTHRVLIEDDTIGGIHCENPDCGVLIEYQHDRHTESADCGHEQTQLTDGGRA